MFFVFCFLCFLLKLPHVWGLEILLKSLTLSKRKNLTNQGSEETIKADIWVSFNVVWGKNTSILLKVLLNCIVDSEISPSDPL